MQMQVCLGLASLASPQSPRRKGPRILPSGISSASIAEGDARAWLSEGGHPCVDFNFNITECETGEGLPDRIISRGWRVALVEVTRVRARS